MEDNCPTCGAKVRVVGRTTKHYEPVKIRVTDGDCVLCGERTNSLAANPNKWCVELPDMVPNSGKMGHYHIGCVMKRLKIRVPEKKEIHVAKGKDWGVCKPENIGWNACIDEFIKLNKGNVLRVPEKKEIAVDEDEDIYRYGWNAYRDEFIRLNKEIE